jgi:hypothetical protein
VAGSRECGDEPSCSGTMELVRLKRMLGTEKSVPVM